MNDKSIAIQKTSRFKIYLSGLLSTLLLALLAFWLSGFLPVGAVVIGISLGIIFSNVIGVKETWLPDIQFANTYYILSQQMKMYNVRKILRKFKVLIEILPVDDKIIELALESDFKDFEDAIQYYTAIENDISIIVTRNLKDFKPAKISVFTAKQYVKSKM